MCCMKKRESSDIGGGNVKLVQLIWKTVLKFPKLKIELLCHPVIALLDIYPEKWKN